LGNETRPGLPIGLLFWLAEQGQLPGAAVTMASLPDFVLANLCQTTPTIETSHAQAHGALNLETLDWHRPALARLGLDGLRWPEIRPHGAAVGKLPFGSSRVPCYTPVGDYQCALAGALVQPGELSLNISTGSQASLLRPRLEFGDYQTRPFFDGRFSNTITHIPAGRALNALVSLLGELAHRQGLELADPWDEVARAAAEVDETDLRVNLAFFASSCGDRGEIANIREENMTVGHLFRAAFENMAENYYRSAVRLSPEAGWRNLVFSGGLGIKFGVLRAIIQRRFGAEYRVCPSPEDTMLGLLALALAFSGRMRSVEEATADLLRRAEAGWRFVAE
jgi:sugar (pentulose or hexulose) kinase